jgi:HD-like signal output (HDOD) protein
MLMPTINILLSQTQNLPNIPEVVRELIQTFNQAEPDLLLIANKVSKDPVISAKLLRLANSARFGCSREVASAKEATVRLGTDTVRNMILASALIESVKPIPGIDMKHFWANVFDIAELSKLLALHKGLSGESIFTCGLMHNIGRLIMHAGLPANTASYISDLEKLKGRAAAEKAVVGFTYADVGAELAKQWNFPIFICDAIRHHYNPMKAEVFSLEAALIHIAIELSTLSEPFTDAPPADWPEKVAEAVGITWPECRKIVEIFHAKGCGYDALIAA